MQRGARRSVPEYVPGSEEPAGPRRALVLAAFATIYLVWGSTYLAIRYAVESFPPLLMSGTRFLCAGVALLAWARSHGAVWPSAAEWRQASPLHRLCGRPAPILLVHSSRRPLAGEQAREFAAAVVRVGGRAEVLSADISHAELNAELGREPDYTARVDAFLRTVVADRDAGDPASA